MKHALLWVILFCMPARSVGLPQATRPAAPPQFADVPEVRAALDSFSRNLAWINDQQIRLTEIPAPPFQEAQRAAAIKALFASSGLEVQIDKAGNVIGELRGLPDLRPGTVSTMAGPVGTPSFCTAISTLFIGLR